MIAADDTVSEVGIVLESTAELCEDVVVGRVCLRGGFERSVLDTFSCFSGGAIEGRGTARAEPFVPAQRRSTLWTLFELGGGVVFRSDDSVVLEDGVVQLFVSNARVRPDLARIFPPVGPVLDLLVTHTLADPLRDSRSTEEMGMDSVRIQASSLRDLRDPASGVLLAERAMFIIDCLPSLVDQCRFGIIRSGVDVQPIGEVSSTPGEWLRAVCILDMSLFVDGDGSPLALNINMLELQREDRTDSEPCVAEQGDESLVSGRRVVLTARVEQGPEFVGGDLLVGIVLAINRCADDDIVGPLHVQPLEELPDGFHVIPDGAISEAVFIFEIELESVDVLDGFHLCERHLGSFSGQADSVHVPDDSPQRFDLRVVRAEVDDPPLDLLTIRFINVLASIEQLPLVLELGLIALDIGYVDHVRHKNGRGDYVVIHSNPPGTTKNFYIIPRGEGRSKTPASRSTVAAQPGVACS